MQGDIERAKFGTFSETAKILYAESGFTGFYRGATFRYGRMCIAVGMMDFLQVRRYYSRVMFLVMNLFVHAFHPQLFAVSKYRAKSVLFCTPPSLNRL